MTLYKAGRSNGILDKHERIVERKQIETISLYMLRCAEMRFEAGTNGYCGGDKGHGSRALVRLQGLGGDIRTEIAPDSTDVTITVCGDDELEMLIDGLEFIVETLKGYIEEGNL